MSFTVAITCSTFKRQ